MKRLITCAALLSHGCVQPQSEPIQNSRLGTTWLQTLATHPDVFAALLENSEKDGWIALHSHDYPLAFRTFMGQTPESRIGKQRAAIALSQMYDRWDRITRYAAQQYEQHHKARGALALSEAGKATIQKSKRCAAPPAEISNLKELATQPSVVDESASGTTIEWYDPCVYSYLTAKWGDHVQPDLQAPDASTEVLAATLFTGGKYNVYGTKAEESASEIRREFSALISAASPEGRDILIDLDASQRFIQETLLQLASHQIANSAYHDALRTSQMTQDTSNSLGPTNGPLLFTIQAEAQMYSGHTRDALHRIAPLTTSFPETKAMREWIGDLSVLKGLDRQGDSKEN